MLQAIILRPNFTVIYLAYSMLERITKHRQLQNRAGFEIKLRKYWIQVIISNIYFIK